MWTPLMLLTLCCWRRTVCASLPSPINVSFSSVNLRNVLHWLPEQGTPEDTHFTVEYAIYGDTIEVGKRKRVHWRPTQHCADITRTWCDVSNETRKEEQSYYARVRAVCGRASSKWALTRIRFDPKTETTFGPPQVSVEIENNNAIVTLNGPMRYSPNNHTPRVSMAAVYPQMTYNLSIHNTRRNHMQHFPGVTSPYRYGLMEYSTEYCFSAQSKFFSMPVRCQSSAWYCITTPQDPVIDQLQRVVVGIVVPTLFLCIIVLAGYLLYNYLSGKDQKSPFILSPPSFHPSPLMLPPENYNVVLITVLTDEPPVDTSSPISDHACPLNRVHIADPPPRYFPQRSESPLEHQEPSDEESTDYGFISLASGATVGGGEEASEKRCDGGDGGSRGKEETCRVVHAPKAKSSFLQRSEMGGHGHASALVTHTQAFFQSLQGRRINGINENRKLPVTFVGNNFHVPPNMQTKSEEDVDGRVGVRTDGEEGGEPETAPLLSGYASQNIRITPTSPHPGQADVLPEDYGVLRVSAMQKAEGDDEDDYDEEEEEGAVCIDWDPESRKLVLPVKMVFTKDRGFDGVKEEEEAIGGEEEEAIGGEEEEAFLKKGELMFENVFVRQASEEEAQGQLEDMVTKWNLVISMNQ